MTLSGFILTTSRLAGGGGEERVLTEEGTTGYTIVIPKDATEAKRSAARELAHHLEKATGARFPVETEDATGARKRRIVLGPTAFSGQVLGRRVLSGPGDDEFIIRTRRTDLLIP